MYVQLANRLGSKHLLCHLPNTLMEFQNFEKGYHCLIDSIYTQCKYDGELLLEIPSWQQSLCESFTGTYRENIQKYFQPLIELLKNEDNILPLNDSFEKIAVIGNMAKNPLFSGNGSSRINTKYKNFSLLEKLQQELPNNEYFYEDGYIFRYDLITPMGLKSAAETAYISDKVILTVGTTDLEEKEETDKYSISLHPGLIRLIELVANQNKNVILVVYSGGSLDLKNIEPLVKAIVYVPVLGEGVNDGLAKILAGKVSPSGKLSETFPLSLRQ